MRNFLFFIVSLILVTCEEPVAKKKEEAKSREQILVDSLNQIAWQTLGKNPERARNVAQEAVKKSIEFGYRQGEADGIKIVGESWRYQAEYDSALICYQKSLTICQEISDDERAARVKNSIGLVFESKDNYEKALSYLQTSLRFFEEKNDSAKMSVIIGNIGRIFTKQKNYEEALRWFFRSLAITEKLLLKDSDNFGYLTSKTATLGNIGMAFDDLGQDEKAMPYYYEYKKLAEKLEDTLRLADAYNSIARVYHEKKNYTQTLENYQRSQDLAQKIGDQKTVCLTKLNIGRVRFALKQSKDAEKEFLESLQIAEEIGDKKLAMENFQELAYLYSGQKRSGEAFRYLEKYSSLRDSILGEESARQVAQMATIYETEKKEKQIEVLNKDQVIKDGQIGRQRLVIIVVAFGIFAILVFAIFLIRSNRARKKANRLLSLQRDEISKQNIVLGEQKAVIEHKSKEIRDSITYAKRIQEAILPPQIEVANTLPKSFILYKPKDIVSGDFYWFYKTNQLALIAAADCTGHGVPGALMSMIGVETLNEAVKQTQNPSEILSIINRTIKAALRQSGESDTTRDGMDIALVKIDLATRELEYAGANRPLWIVRDDKKEVEEIKATKKAIAGFTDDDQVYELHKVSLGPKDTFYIFSDGYADQFGGERGKKLMTSKLKEILLLIRDRLMADQHDYLDRHMEEWRQPKNGKVHEQVDDILVIGVKV